MTAVRGASRLIHEPLFQFLVAGGALFFLYSAVQDSTSFDPDSREINLPEARIEFISARFARTWSRAPTMQELQGLVDAHVREEVYYREALALGLDKNDPTVRRRMQQKLTFLFADLNALVEPNDQELQDWLDANKDDYVQSARTSFQQIYLGSDQVAAPGIAQDLIQALERGENPEELGEPTLLAKRIDADTDAAIERRFGQQFVRGLTTAKSGVWSGPIDSTFGAHLVYVEQRMDARQPEFDELRSKLRLDFMHARQIDSEERRYAQMLKHYQVNIEWPATPEKESSGSQ